MMKIQSLLNPPSGERLEQEREPTQSPVPEQLKPKRQKMSKVAAIFLKGKAKEPVRYLPHDHDDDEQLAAEHRKFNIHPLGRIGDYPRHIPYNSEKKSFLAKTGREAVEVFQYNFSIPGDDRNHLVMWDYNIGLVRVTPFFKACRYSKTTPARVLNINPGLRDISHSITGGALAAQGYWMPFEAAKAVAATFCYHIRHALTPIFGTDFQHLCLLPDDPAFGSFKIDRAIVQRCTALANEFRLLYSGSTSSYSPAISAMSSPAPPSIGGGDSEAGDISSSGGIGGSGGSGGSSRDRGRIAGEMSVFAPRSTPQLSSYTPWGGPKTPPRSHAGAPTTADIESGYGTDTDASDKYLCSPGAVAAGSTQHQTWASTSGELSPKSKLITGSEVPACPSPWLSSVPRSFVPPPAAVVGTKRGISDVEDDEVGDDALLAGSGELDALQPSDLVNFTSREAQAAIMLLRLHDADASQVVGHRGKRSRRASA